MTSHSLVTLKNRSDFLRIASKGKKVVTDAMVVQAAHSHDSAEYNIRIGYTASKKTGNAVDRNRIKRRMRAAAREIITQYGQPGIDYVLIGRRFCVQSPYDTLCKDLENAIHQLNKALS